MKKLDDNKIRFGIIGLGTVGQGIYKLWHRVQKKTYEEYGIEIEISKIGVRDLDKERKVHVPAHLLTDDVWKFINDPEIDVIIELAGGMHPSYEWVSAALKLEKPVITANKALLCDWGHSLFNLARKMQTPLFYEASVCSGMPIIKIIRESFVACKIHTIRGIMNGSTNYILSQMEKYELSYDTVVAEARNLGYLEADESLDLDGWDAAHKAVILGYLISGIWLRKEDIHVEGIRNVTLEDLQKAHAEGSTIKLLADIHYDEKEQHLSIVVEPKCVAFSDPLSQVYGSYNALLLESDLLGQTFIKGTGAGQDSAASAVLGDVMDLVHFYKKSRT